MSRFLNAVLVIVMMIAVVAAKPHDLHYRSCGAYIAGRVTAICGSLDCPGIRPDFSTIACAVGLSDLTIMEMCCPPQ